MIALYFTAFPQEAEDYNSWMSSKYSDEDYDDEYEEDNDYYYDDYRDYYNKNKYDEDYIKPLFFDEMLKSYINQLSIEEQKQILYEELNQNKKRTLDKYLKETYNKYIKDNKSLNSFVELLYKNTQELTKDYDFNYKDYNVTIISNRNKNKVKEIYNDNKFLIEKLDKVLLNPKLTVYNDYKWIANFYKDKLSKEELKTFNNEIIINGNERALYFLEESKEFKTYYKRIIDSTKNVVILEKLYKHFGEIDKLFNLLYNKENEYRLIENIEILDEKYNKELYQYFKERFYKKIGEGKQRKIYEDASKHIKAIYKLSQGEALANKIIKELQESEYSNRPALFEEIYKAINC